MKATTQQLQQLGTLVANAHVTQSLSTDPETVARAEGVQSGVLAAMLYLMPERQVESWCDEGEITLPRIERLLRIARGMNEAKQKTKSQEPVEA